MPIDADRIKDKVSYNLEVLARCSPLHRPSHFVSAAIIQSDWGSPACNPFRARDLIFLGKPGVAMRIEIERQQGVLLSAMQMMDPDAPMLPDYWAPWLVGWTMGA